MYNFEDFKVGDIVYFVNDTNTEHIIQISDIDYERGLVTSKYYITLLKTLDNNQINYTLIDNMLIMSNMSNDEENNSEITINADYFQIYGKVTNEKVLEIFSHETAKKILNPKPKLKRILG